jgi:hypothetical protein
VDEDIWDHSQLIAESAVFPKAVATLVNTEFVTEEPSEPMELAIRQMGFADPSPVHDI